MGQMAEAKYQRIATQLREAINTGDYPPGSRLPTIIEIAAQHRVSKATANAAISLLEAEGLVRPMERTGIRVLDQRSVRVPLSRYSHVLTPGGQLGPWETALAAAGIPGRMVLLEVEHVMPDPDVATALEINPLSRVVRRVRHAVLGDEDSEQVIQLHEAIFPARLVADTPIAGDGKLVGGVYAALAAAGLTPATADEVVTARTATPEEIAQLYMRGGMILSVERITRDASGRPLELLRVAADPARSVFVYDGLPLSR